MPARRRRRTAAATSTRSPWSRWSRTPPATSSLTADGTVSIPDAIVTDEKVVQIIEVDLPEGAEPGDDQLVEMIDEALAGDDEETR